MAFLRPDTPYYGLKGGWLIFWITIACGTDMLLFGYDQGVFGGVVISEDFLHRHDLVGPTKTKLLSTVTAIYTVGCFLGAMVATYLGERLGRKKTIIVGTAVMTIGAILQVSSYSYGHMMAGRIITGMGNGINTSTAPVWQTETSTIKWRGKLVVIEMVLNIAGFSVSNWINYGISFASGPVTWRFPLAFQWLVAHGRNEEAIQIIADLESKEVNDPYIAALHGEMQYSVNYERENALSWSALARGKTNEKAGTKTVRRLILGMGMQLMQQLSGINITSYYLPTVLTSSVGLSANLARLLAACNSVQYLLFSFIGIMQVEKWGRRKLMMYAAAGQCFCYVIISALIRYNEKPGYPNAEKVASASVAFFFLYYVFFGIGMQGVPWLYPTEINSLAMRTKGSALATATNWVINFMIVEITPIGIQNLGWRFYMVWIVMNACMVPAVYLFYPETAGRSLEDMDDYYRGNPPLLVFRDKEAISSKRPDRYIQRERDEQAEIIRKESVAVPKPNEHVGASTHLE